MKFNLKDKINYKNVLYLLIPILFSIGLFGVGLYFGYSHRPEIDKVKNVINKSPSFETNADFNIFWKAWNILKDKSYYANDIGDEERLWGAISGLAGASGDEYTTFFNPKENKQFKEEIKGSFSGIGAEIGVKDKILTVISPLKDSPSFKAGLKKGDKVLKIDDKISSDMSIDKAISLIRGEKGTVVTLTVLREGESKTREIKITRDIIDIPVIETEVLEDNIFLIKFYSFTQNADQKFAKAITEFAELKSRKLIIDLRGNPGGYLEVAVNIASWFLDEGKIVVSEDFGENIKQKIYRSHGPRVFNDNLELVILIDGGSASASEILAGALKEHGIATLVGEKTFGKGSVQELVDITDDTSIKITIAKWFTPKGKSISPDGLKPDVNIPYTIKDFENNKDPQLNEAIKILKNSL